MRFKKSKQDLLSEIEKIGTWSNLSAYDITNSPMGSIGSNVEMMVRQMIKNHVNQTMQIIMDNIYTDEEFERDVLK